MLLNSLAEVTRAVSDDIRRGESIPVLSDCVFKSIFTNRRTNC